MRKTIIIIFLFTSVTSLFSEKRYFRKINIDKYYNIVGRFEVDKSVSETINCYEFDYLDERVVSVEFLRSGYSISDPFFGVTKINIYYDDEFRKWEFSDGKGARVSNDDSIFSYRIKYGSNGLPHSVFYYNHLGQLIRGMNRIAVVHYNYIGNTRQEFAFNQKGTQVLFDDGISGRVSEFGDDGRVLSTRFLDSNGESVNCINEKYSSVRYMYDEQDNLIEKSFYNKSGELTANNKGIAVVKKFWNEKGNLIELQNMGADKNLISSGEESAVVMWDYDNKGNKIREAHYSSDLEPAMDMMNVSIYEWTHYEQGNELEQRNYNREGELTLDEDGFASYRWIYDDRGNILQVMYYDEFDNLKANPWGIAKYKWTYDDIGRKTEVRHYGSYEKITPNENGVSIVKYRYDDNGNLSKKINMDGDRLINDKNGVSQYHYTYNSENVLTEIRQFGKLGQLKADLDFVAIYQRKYDTMGNLIEERYLGIDEKLVENREGTALLKQRFLRDGSQVEFKKYNRNRLIISE